jgi:alpha-amylase/alpha-mannosidase (GH57 family)
MERYVCIHGHFYQPPRENPWLEAIELQDSAYPYHDWNERITAECYGPNAVSRILDSQDRIVRIVNNYARISFNFGPTLLSWMERKAPEVYRAVLDADVESRARYGGHGSALAQGYNHIILPLASLRDKRTQVAWGVADFVHRFGRRPEGMWLPETAVDVESLELLAEHGIEFTVLAPRQARGVRKVGDTAWTDVSGSRVDPSMAYRIPLPSGRSIAAFFYDGPISQGVAFEGLLHRGEQLAHRLLGAFAPARKHAQLAHIATDGETYGHHHRRGEMALAYALHYIETNKLATLTNYGQFLEKFPPTYEATVFDNSSWSCVHGVERWRSDCGCSTGSKPGWNQAWRGPLRAALDWLRDELVGRYQERAGRYLGDPWAARDAYIDVLLVQGAESAGAEADAFFARHALRALTAAERALCQRLLEMQRQTMLMYTSCGWFFDELSGIEPVQVMQYAGRALQLCHEIFGEDLEPTFLELLERARSNVPELRDGRAVYERNVKPAVVDLKKVVAHYAMTSLFEDYPERADVYSYTIERRAQRAFEAGSIRVVVGRASASARITAERGELLYSALHVGDHNVHAGVREASSDDAYAALLRDLGQPFEDADLPTIIRVLDRHFGTLSFSLRALFRDEQRRILELILAPTMARAETTYQHMYEANLPLMRFLSGLGVRLPRPFLATAEFALNSELRLALDWEELDAARIKQLLAEARACEVPLDNATLEYTLRRSIEVLTQRLVDAPEDVDRVERLEAAARVARSLPFTANLYECQNAYWRLLQSTYPLRVAAALAGDDAARAWVASFRALGEVLRVRVP